jgi:hypothetical protein
MEKARRRGGVNVDPKVGEWQNGAATNLAALTAKQRKDRERVRVKYDLPPELKADIEAEAKGWGTSASQLAAFLLAWAMKEYHARNDGLRQAVREARTPAKALRFTHDLEIPDEWGKVPA